MKKIILALTLLVLLLVPIIGSATETNKIYIPYMVVDTPPTPIPYPPPEEPTNPNIGVISERSMCFNKEIYNPNTNLKLTIRWSEVETEDGYNWNLVDHLFCGYEPKWVLIHSTPAKYLNDGELKCKLPKDDYEFYKFIKALKERYEFIEYVEIWNEPNSNHNDPKLARLFGCIENGGEYGEFIDHLSKNLKRNNIDLKVIAGALTNLDNKQWIEDMLYELNDNYYGMSIHCYPMSIGDTINSEECLKRYNELKRLTGGKPVYLSEVSAFYVSGTREEYLNNQIKFYRFLKNYIKTYWYWFLLHYNGWPIINIGCYRMSTDMISKNLCTNEEIIRPILTEYLSE